MLGLMWRGYIFFIKFILDLQHLLKNHMIKIEKSTKSYEVLVLRRS